MLRRTLQALGSMMFDDAFVGVEEASKETVFENGCHNHKTPCA